MRLFTLMAIGIATTLSTGAAVNTSALQSQLRSLNDAKQSTLQLLNNGKINQATADARISIIDAQIMHATATATEGTWVPTLEIVKDAEGVPTSKIERKYNDNAQLIEAKYYNINNGDEESAYPYSIETYEYDEAGNRTLQQYFYYWNGPETPSSASKLEYAYDSKGNTTKSLRFWLDTATDKWIPSYQYFYAFDSKGNLTLYENNGDYQDDKFQYGYKWERAYDAEGNSTLSVNYDWDVENQTFNVTNKRIQEFTNGRRTFYEFSQMINGKLTVVSSEARTFDANGNQTSEDYKTWDGSELVGQNCWESTYNENGQQTSYSSYQWENGKWAPSYKITTEYGETLTTSTQYNAAGEEWVPSYKQETPVNGDGEAQYYWDATKKEWWLVNNTMTIYDPTTGAQTQYNLSYDWATVDGVRQYTGTKTEYTYDDRGMQSYTTYKWDNEKQDWAILIMQINIENISTTGLVEKGYVDTEGGYGYKNVSFYRTGTLMWDAYYNWDSEKQDFVEVYKNEYTYTLDENGNIATRECYRNGELIETIYYFYTEVGTSGIDDVTTATGAFTVTGNTITFSAPTQVAVYTVDGKMVHNGVTETLTLTSGALYIVKGEGWSKKIAL